MENLTKDNFTGTNSEGAFPNPTGRYLTAKTIIGDKVHDLNDNEMGHIEDVMIDVVAGKIDYVIVEFGGFLGIGTKYFAIPHNMLQVNGEKKLFVFKGDKSMLENAPGFDLNHWPDTNFHEEEKYWNFDLGN